MFFKRKRNFITYTLLSVVDNNPEFEGLARTVAIGETPHNNRLSKEYAIQGRKSDFDHAAPKK
jgi:hypothetical protein